MSLKLSVSLVLLFIFLTGAHGQSTSPYGGILNGKAIDLPKPEYPPEAKEFCAGGKVEVRVLISEKGDVIEAEALSGDDSLRAVSVEAVKRAKFGTNNDAGPVKTNGIIVYNFDSLAPKCISAGIANKKALKLPKPVINLRPPKKESITAVQIIVDMNGSVTAARAVSGHPLVRSAAVAAARQTKFSPMLINGPPLKVKALLVYRFKPDGSVETNIESDDQDVIKTPINLVEPPFTECNCKGLGGSVSVEAQTDEQGNVTDAKAVSGHPILRESSEKAARESKFLPTRKKAKLLIIYNFEAVGNGAKIKNVEIRRASLIQ